MKKSKIYTLFMELFNKLFSFITVQKSPWLVLCESKSKWLNIKIQFCVREVFSAIILNSCFNELYTIEVKLENYSRFIEISEGFVCVLRKLKIIVVWYSLKILQIPVYLNKQIFFLLSLLFIKNQNYSTAHFQQIWVT